MKNYLSILIIILSFNTSFAQTREWKSINANQNSCHGLLNSDIQRRLINGLSDDETYEARIIFTTGQFDYDFELNFKGDKEASWGRITVPAQGQKIVEVYGEYKATDIISFTVERLLYVGLELKHLRGEERYVRCGEGANEVLRRDEAKGKNKASNTSIEMPDNEEDDNKVTTKNEGYQVLDVDTSEYEADKTRKRQLAEEKRREIAEQDIREREYKERKEKFEREQLAKLNRSTQAYEQRQTNLTNAGNTVLNALDNMSQQADVRRARQMAVYEKEARQRNADRAYKKERDAIEFKKRKESIEKKIRDKEELEAKVKLEEILEESQLEFIKSLIHQSLPLVVSTNKVFFYMVDISRNLTRSIRFAPFTIIADANKQIPYRKDIIEDFELKTGTYGYSIYGPYTSQLEQESAMKAMAANAARIEIGREKDLFYTYVQKNRNENNSKTDFWGNKTKPKQKKNKKQTKKSFWDN
ncbi:hypothetical protein [Tenacibaculum bernardetii]|uniref:hypothetical protein n=1 Tax=Tenacibaculum bernardetii TaxID=3021375 RepID=UPI0023B07758|nr:hypothetical protein [Tenacibaculum bernardetii]